MGSTIPDEGSNPSVSNKRISTYKPDILVFGHMISFGSEGRRYDEWVQDVEFRFINEGEMYIEVLTMFYGVDIESIDRRYGGEIGKRRFVARLPLSQVEDVVPLIGDENSMDSEMESLEDVVQDLLSDRLYEDVAEEDVPGT